MDNTVDQVIHDYIKGTYTGNIELLQSVFHKSAIMSGFLGPDLQISSPQPFIDDIGSSASMETNGDDYHAEIISKKVTGKIADVIVKETGFRNSVDLENHFHLVNDGGRWWIISKLFTVL